MDIHLQFAVIVSTCDGWPYGKDLLGSLVDALWTTYVCSAASAGACSHAAARARKWSIYSCSPFGSCKATDPAATHLLAYLGDVACSLRWEGDSASRSLHHTTVVKRECEGVIAIAIHPNPSRSKHETRALQPGLRMNQTRTCVLHTRATDSE